MDTRAEASGTIWLANEFHVRAFTYNLGEQRYLVEGHRDGCHCGDKLFNSHPDALAFADMEAKWHTAKLIDHVGKRHDGAVQLLG